MPTEYTEDTEELSGLKTEIRTPIIATVSIREFGLTRLFFRVLCVFRGQLSPQCSSRTPTAHG